MNFKNCLFKRIFILISLLVSSPTGHYYLSVSTSLKNYITSNLNTLNIQFKLQFDNLTNVATTLALAGNNRNIISKGSHKSMIDDYLPMFEFSCYYE